MGRASVSKIKVTFLGRPHSGVMKVVADGPHKCALMRGRALELLEQCALARGRDLELLAVA